MKILKLTAENIKKLIAVEITPAGEIVQIVGKNGAGKTSVLDSIWLALDHTRVGAKMPIRKGENKARIRLDLGELIVERKFTETGSTLTVESTEGARFPSPQTMLDALLGELSFDPLAFARMTPRDQYDELRRISKLEVDLDDLDRLNLGDYDRRTAVNRDAKMKRAQAAGIMVADGLPEAAVDETAILDRIQGAGERNATVEKHRVAREREEERIALAEEETKRTRIRAADLHKEAQALEEEATRLDAIIETERARFAALDPLPALVDAAAIRAELESARTTNRLISVRDSKRKLEAEAETLEGQAKALTEKIQGREQAKTAAIQKSNMPVEGLGFGEGMVTFQGVPFEQASSAEQLRVSLSIAMAANPNLRVIRIQNGSLLDQASLAAISAMAKAGDFQIWIEMVSDDGKVGIVIEDGMVKSTPESRKP